jgi:hypothetical protein
MGFLSKLFREGKREKALANIKSQFGEDALLPSLPSTQNQDPLKLFKVEGFNIALLVDVPPWLSEEYGDATIPICLMATNDDASLIYFYTAQRIFPNKPPVLVVWQPDGNPRIHSETFQEPINPSIFLKSFFPHLIKELGLSGNVEVIVLK